jgi:hypothetical protein
MVTLVPCTGLGGLITLDAELCSKGHELECVERAGCRPALRGLPERRETCFCPIGDASIADRLVGVSFVWQAAGMRSEEGAGLRF